VGGANVSAGYVGLQVMNIITTSFLRGIILHPILFSPLVTDENNLV